jgi:hypothetical protein
VVATTTTIIIIIIIIGEYKANDLAHLTICTKFLRDKGRDDDCVVSA